MQYEGAPGDLPDKVDFLKRRVAATGHKHPGENHYDGWVHQQLKTVVGNPWAGRGKCKGSALKGRERDGGGENCRGGQGFDAANLLLTGARTQVGATAAQATTSEDCKLRHC